MTPDQDGELRDVTALIELGDDTSAFALVRTRLAWPRGKDVADLPRWLELLGELAARRGADALADLARATVRDPDNPDSLYDLGYALIDAGVPSIAASVLWRCLALVGDSEEVVCELVSALESALEYRDAFAILGEHASLRGRSFLCQYLYGFNAAMSGRLDITREVVGALVADGPEAEAMCTTLQAIVERADRVAGAAALDGADLRGWQYALTGTLVLHPSPYGYPDPMHGRFAWLQDSLARVATAIHRLATLVTRVDVPCIYAPPDRVSEILAEAIARRTGLPRAPWPAVGIPAPGLVVVYDLAELPAADIPRLVDRRADQILFAHGTPWTQDAPIAPDVTTLLYQTLVPPWGESTIVDPATQEVSRSEPDRRSVEDIAAELATHAGLEGDDLVADDPTGWAALVEKAWPPLPGRRSRMWAGGPVPSNRFV